MVCATTPVPLRYTSLSVCSCVVDEDVKGPHVDMINKARKYQFRKNIRIPVDESLYKPDRVRYVLLGSIS